MKVSLITICFNNEKEIAQTIESVVNQTYLNIEYIVIDGKSQDDTINIINNYRKNISHIISEKDEGIYDAINKGIDKAKGDIIGLIHGGDLLYDNFVIEKIVNHFELNDIEALYGHSKIYSSDGKKVVRINKSTSYKHKLFRIGWFPSHQSFYAKRKLFLKYGNYNIKYQIAADYELVLRFLYLHKIKVKLLDEYIIKFKLGGTSTKSLKNIIKLNKECMNAWNDNGMIMPFYLIPLKLYRKVVQLIQAKTSNNV